MTRPHPTFRLVDGSQLSDWHPGPGDAPCDARSHTDHSRNECPDLFIRMES